MNRIVLDCPTCHKTKLQLFPALILEELKHPPKGFVGVHITRDITCNHEYVIYIDKNFTVQSASPIENIPKMGNDPIFELSTKNKNGHPQLGQGPR